MSSSAVSSVSGASASDGVVTVSKGKISREVLDLDPITFKLIVTIVTFFLGGDDAEKLRPINDQPLTIIQEVLFSFCHKFCKSGKEPTNYDQCRDLKEKAKLGFQVFKICYTTCFENIAEEIQMLGVSTEQLVKLMGIFTELPKVTRDDGKEYLCKLYQKPIDEHHDIHFTPENPQIVDTKGLKKEWLGKLVIVIEGTFPAEEDEIKNRKIGDHLCTQNQAKLFGLLRTALINAIWSEVHNNWCYAYSKALVRLLKPLGSGAFDAFLAARYLLNTAIVKDEGKFEKPLYNNRTRELMFSPEAIEHLTACKHYTRTDGKIYLAPEGGIATDVFCEPEPAIAE